MWPPPAAAASRAGSSDGIINGSGWQLADGVSNDGINIINNQSINIPSVSSILST
jgi:hypothetical protein